jgi:hypothetical protein
MMSSTTGLPAGATTDKNGGTVYNGFAGQATATSKPGENGAARSGKPIVSWEKLGTGTYLTGTIGVLFVLFGILV